MQRADVRKRNLRVGETSPMVSESTGYSTRWPGGAVANNNETGLKLDRAPWGNGDSHRGKRDTTRRLTAGEGNKLRGAAGT